MKHLFKVRYLDKSKGICELYILATDIDEVRLYFDRCQDRRAYEFKIIDYNLKEYIEI